MFEICKYIFITGMSALYFIVFFGIFFSILKGIKQMFINLFIWMGDEQLIAKRNLENEDAYFNDGNHF